MAHCPACGAEYGEREVRCASCGADLSEPEPEPVPDDRLAYSDPAYPGGQSADRTDSSRAGPTDFLYDIVGSRHLVAIGSILVIAGAFLPWVTMVTFGEATTTRGIDEDGRYTLILAIAVATMLLVAWTPKTKAVTMLFGVAITYLSFPLFVSVEIFSRAIATGGDVQPLVDTEPGLYLTLLGGVVLMTIPGYSLLIEYLENQEQAARHRY